MDKLYKDVLDKPFKVDDIVYVHSGSFERRIGTVSGSHGKFIHVLIGGINTLIKPEHIRHYTKGESLYPDQFTPCKEKQTFAKKDLDL